MIDYGELTHEQRDLYNFIREKLETRGYGPTLREIGEAFEIMSPDAVMCRLKALEKSGLILRKGRSARALIPTAVSPCADTWLREENERLKNDVDALQADVGRLKDEAAVREQYVREVQDAKRCPDCQRSYWEWY